MYLASVNHAFCDDRQKLPCKRGKVSKRLVTPSTAGVIRDTVITGPKPVQKPFLFLVYPHIPRNVTQV